MIEPDVLERLLEENWESTYPRMVAYAVTQVGKLRFVKGGGLLPKGYDPADLVDEAINRVFEGKRRWRPDRQPDLIDYLAGVIDSLLSNLITSAENKRRADISIEDLDRLGAVATDANPLEIMLAAESASEFAQICDEATADDPDLQNIRIGLEDGLNSGEIAELFELPVERVYQLTQKFKRRVLRRMEGRTEQQAK